MVLKKSEKTKTKKSESSKTVRPAIFEILVVIVNRGQGDEIRSFLKKWGVNILSSSFGEGTANSTLQSILGLSIEKEVVFSFINIENKDELLDELEKNILLLKKNMGIAFTIPLKSITKNSLNKVERGE